MAPATSAQANLPNQERAASLEKLVRLGLRNGDEAFQKAMAP